MRSAKQVDEFIAKMKADNVPLSEAIFRTAMECVGWPYVYGARGELTTKDGIQVRKFDCRGFTYWVCLQYGIRIEGTGCTSQWNEPKNWRGQGAIADGIPDDMLVCLFHRKKDEPNKMAHTGFGYKGSTAECQNGVQYFEERKSKWQYWAVPVGIEGEIPVPTTKPTLRRGDKGEWVSVLQTKLLLRGYDLGKAGVDGSYGKATESAVRAFQMDAGLTQDGICGKKTWAALDEDPVALWTVTVPHLPKTKAEELVKEYVGATMTEERG